MPELSGPGEDRGQVLLGAAQALANRLSGRGAERDERLGEIFLACDFIAREDPDVFARAASGEELAESLLPRVERMLETERAQRFGGGWLGTYVGPDGREIERDGEDTTDPERLALGRQALQRALSQARTESNATLERNLRWYQARMAHKSYTSIARAEGKPAATIRTGVARARKYVLRVVHELQHAQPAPLTGEAPPDLEPLRALWFKQDLDALEAGLEATREAFSNDPHWLNLSGLLRADRGERDRAMALYERALVFADAPSVRGRVLNNMGNLTDDLGRPEDAHHYWLRAHQLLPEAPAPLMNLLASAAASRDYASAQHYLSEVGALLSSERLTDEDRQYILRRLIENPRLAWLRDTDAWRVGPARWLRAARRRKRRIATALAITAALLIPGLSFAATPDRSFQVALLTEPVPTEEARSRGGDSMGSPRGRGKRAVEPARFTIAGDSMGFTGRKGPKRPPQS